MIDFSYQILRKYNNLKRLKLNKLKGGNKEMETKSRYEVIAELEEKKRNLIISKEGLQDKLKQMQRELKNQERELEDQKEEIEYFKSQMKNQTETYEELIKSIDESLERFSKLNQKS